MANRMLNAGPSIAPTDRPQAPADSAEPAPPARRLFARLPERKAMTGRADGMSKLLLAGATVALALGVAACGSLSSTTPQTTTPPSATSTTAPSTTTSSTAPSTTTTTIPAVGTGQTLTVGAGDKVTMYVLKITDPATPASSSDAAPAGQHLVSVTIKVRGLSGTSTADANGTIVIGSNGQTYEFTVTQGLAGCTNFNYGDFTVTPGESQVGCVAFAVPNGVKIAQVSYVAPLGMGDTSATWKVG
jgi:hypothetical protein